MGGTWRKKLSVLAGAAALALVFAGTTGAYLTHSPETLKNIITAGKIDVRVEEPAWRPENGTGLVPGCEVSKDPTAVNTGKNDAWIFLKVRVPVKKMITVDPETKRKQPAQEMALFSFAAAKDWELIEKNRKDGFEEFIYGYQSVVKPGEKTSPLFEKVVLVNYLEGQLKAAEKLTIPVEAMAIQTGVSTPEEGLKRIYEIYLEQKEEG